MRIKAKQTFTHLTETEVMGKSIKFPQNKSSAALVTINLAIVNEKYGSSDLHALPQIHQSYFLESCSSFQPHLSPGFGKT